jgi:hypothetical protein
MLMDAGEGTMGQIWRMFGTTEEVEQSEGAATMDFATAAVQLSPRATGPPQLQPPQVQPPQQPQHGATAVLTSLRAVWISHPHADHHLGLLRLLTERQRVVSASSARMPTARVLPLLLIAPACVQRWLCEYATVDGAIAGSYEFVDCEDVAVSGGTHARLRAELGLTECWNTRVIHCSNAYALIMR